LGRDNGSARALRRVRHHRATHPTTTTVQWANATARLDAQQRYVYDDGSRRGAAAQLSARIYARVCSLCLLRTRRGARCLLFFMALLIVSLCY